MSTESNVCEWDTTCNNDASHLVYFQGRAVHICSECLNEYNNITAKDAVAKEKEFDLENVVLNSDIDCVLAMIKIELLNVLKNHKEPLNSFHEGIAVVRERYKKLENEVFEKTPDE